jgi:hypothetical protein
MTECGWCEAERIEGTRHDAGRPLTPEEAAVGFWATHAECRPLLAGLLDRLNAKGVRVEVNGIEAVP